MRRGQLVAVWRGCMKMARPCHRADHRFIQQERQLHAAAASRLQRLTEAVPVDLAEL